MAPIGAARSGPRAGGAVPAARARGDRAGTTRACGDPAKPGLAIGYNLLALPLAAAGLVTPWLAAVGITLSSLAVTLNALRLARSTQKVRA